MITPPAECRSIRDRLLALALNSGDEDSLEGTVREHIRTCPGCTKYREGLKVMPELLRATPLYTPALRRRTLAAVEPTRPSWLAPLLLPASTASLGMTVFVPIWLLTTLLRPVFGSGWFSLGLAFVLSSSAGLAAVGLGLAVLIRRQKAGPAPAGSGALFREVSRG
jgi:hypothetical protein